MRLSFKFLLFIVANICKFVQNHKHSQEPLLLLISFDGFRWDYLQKHNLTNFNYLKANGVYADWIYNSFATVTFPNHWTIVTGLYEETHGIVHNSMYDPILNETFNISVFGAAETKWFAQNPVTEPIWITNQKASKSRLSAAEWVASDMRVHNEEVISIPYNHSRPFKELVDQFITLFTNENAPINFGALYFDEPDHTGHLYGPYSNEMAAKLQDLDDLLGYLIEELKDHHLFDKLNLIITSDHGMEQISNDTVIFLDQHVNTDLFNAYGSHVLMNLFFNDRSKLDETYNKLKEIENLIVYKKKEIPDSLNYKNNVRIGDIVVVARLGYAIYVKTQSIDWKLTNGDHGYLNNQSSMFPIFIAHGPAFKSGYKIESFNNVDIYPLMCFILGIGPSVNNGSLEKVIDMLKVNYIEHEVNIYFILLLVLPIVTLGFSMICVFFISKHRMIKSINMSNNGYTSLNSDETIVDVDDEYTYGRQ